MRLIFVNIFNIFVTILVIFRQINSIKIEISRNIENQGYHRFLITEIKLRTNDSILMTNDCKLLILENFDKNIYVDVYELKQKMYEQTFTFYLSNKVNTETAGYKSQRFQLFMYIATNRFNCSTDDHYQLSNDTLVPKSTFLFNCHLNIRVPIHVRYHSSKVSTQSPTDENENELNGTDQESTSSEYVQFTLKKPRIFVNANCSTPAVIPAAQPTKSNVYKKPIIATPVPQVIEIELPCEKNKKLRNDYLFFVNEDAKNKSNRTELLMNKFKSVCKWKETKFEYTNESELLTIQIPTGNREHETIILIVTLVTLTLLAFSVAKCVRKKITSIDCMIKYKDREKNNNVATTRSSGETADENETKELNPKKE